MTPPQNPRMTPKKIRKTTTFSSGLVFSDMDSIASILSKIVIALGIIFSERRSDLRGFVTWRGLDPVIWSERGRRFRWLSTHQSGVQ
jgi:hypothetical protein